MIDYVAPQLFLLFVVSVLVFLFRVVFMALPKLLPLKCYLVLYLLIPFTLISIILVLLRKLVMVLEVFKLDYI